MWGPSTVPLACMPCGGCVPRGWWGAVPGGGWPATVVRGVWCQALSLSQPPRPLGRAARALRPVRPAAVVVGVGTQHLPRSLRPCGPALRAVGVAEGRPRGGGAFPRCEGHLRSGTHPPPTACPLGGLSGSATHVLPARVCGCGGPALAPWLACPVGGCAPRGWWGASWFRRPPSPGCPPSWRAAEARWPRDVGAGVGPCGVCGVCAVCAVVRGASLRLSLWCPPLRWSVAVLCPPCACRAPFLARVPCSAAGYLLFLLWFRRSLPFPLLSKSMPVQTGIFTQYKHPEKYNGHSDLYLFS